MKIYKNNRGFTLIELLLVVGIVAVILAVIVPMGLRARIDAKYGVVRQNASELAGFTSQWVEKSIQAQDEQLSTSTVNQYYASLANNTAAPPAGGFTAGTAFPGYWIADTAANNWNFGATGIKANRAPIAIPGRFMNGVNNTVPEDVVEDIVPPDKVIRNPFTEVSVFRPTNFPQGNVAITGALAFGGVVEAAAVGSFSYYAITFQGTDSTTATAAPGGGNNLTTDFHAGMGLDTIARIRNAVFVGRFR
jgi:prepilin-type N-terminal cleavage/methylation domain-containing protein